jgi:NAD(P)-dependent dehydrogenase (short-subunit alcohol dehydrogenase family)|tara:strand:- start:86 stop:829 length:744 start_codon:yes stop_codon:yes gene_type:complete
MKSLENKNIIVTGGGRGIGEATCKLLAKEGANVVITCRTEEEGLTVEKEILDFGGSAKFISHDVTLEESWKNIIGVTLETFNRLDSVVNNAGSFISESITDCRLEDFQDVIRTSLNGSFLGLKYGTQAIRNHGEGGSIVMMSSILAKVGAMNLSALSAAHGGVNLLAKAGACELGPEKIRVNSIHPGLVDTYSENSFSDEEFIKNNIPFNRLATPEEVAETVRFLVSDESIFMTGAELTIDGGMIAQ